MSDYSASKFGAVGFNESLRMEIKKLKKNIKTTCVCPYFIKNNLSKGVKIKYPFFLPMLDEEYAA